MVYYKHSFYDSTYSIVLFSLLTGWASPGKVQNADVYDALVSKRVYKDAFSETFAEKIIREEAGRHFEPTLVNVFLENLDEIRRIKMYFH